MRPETELIISLSRTPLRPDARNRARELLEAGIDWHSVLRLAERWRVEPTVFGNLGSEFPEVLPGPVRTEAAALATQARAHTVSRTLILLDLLESFAQAGIPVIVLKGPAIAIAAYDDCSRRTFGDADLLVRPRDLTRARDLLITRGYSAHFGPELERRIIAGQHALEFSDSRTSVELHWTLISRYLRFNVSLDELWSEARVTDCLDSHIKTLAPEHLFLYLCAHGAKHEWVLFRWICDIAQLADRLTPIEAERVVSLAEKTNARRLLSLGLRLARSVFGVEPSPFPPAAFGAESDTARLVALVRDRLILESRTPKTLLPLRVAGIHEYMDPLAFWLISRERMTDRFACVAQFIFLPAAGDNSHGRLQRVLRPVRLAANALRRLAHA